MITWLCDAGFAPVFKILRDTDMYGVLSGMCVNFHTCIGGPFFSSLVCMYLCVYVGLFTVCKIYTKHQIPRAIAACYTHGNNDKREARIQTWKRITCILQTEFVLLFTYFVVLSCCYHTHSIIALGATKWFAFIVYMFIIIALFAAAWTKINK